MPRTKEAFKQIRDESRQHILDKAAEVFAQKGLANTKISELAQAAGISQGLLYRYFADKDDIFIALLDRAVDGVINIAQGVVKRSGTPMEKLRWLTEQVLQGMSEEPVYYQLVSQAMALSGRAYKALWKLETLVKTLRELVTEGQSAGEIAKRDPDQLVLLYFSCLYGLAAGRGLNMRWIDDNFPLADSVLQILRP